MQIVYPSSETRLPEVAACIGFFDGVHRGHRFLIGELIAESKRRGLASAVITFRNHPRQLIDPDFCPQLISSFDEKMEMLAETGVDYCFVLDFTPALRNLTACEFIHQILRKQVNATLLLIGYDHRFGKNRTDGFEDYQRYGAACGMEVMKEPDYSPSGMHVSSSAIRRALKTGQPALAAHLLGEAYHLEGKVVAGSQIGRTIGFPTANVMPFDKTKIIPKNGVYAVFVQLGETMHPGMLNIGNRPTVDESEQISIEVNLLDFEGDLYGSTLNIHFIEYLREERKMESLDDLKQQLTADRQMVLNIIRKRKPMLR